MRSAASRVLLELALVPLLVLPLGAARAASAPAPSAKDVKKFAGFWHGSAIMPADYVNNLMLFPDGRFYLDEHLDRTCLGTTRGLAPDAVLGLVGRWSVEDGGLTLRGEYRHEAGPGTCPCSDPAELEFEGHGCYLELPATRLVPVADLALRPRFARKAFAGDASLGVPPLAGLRVKGAAFAGSWYRLPAMGAAECFRDVVRVGSAELLAWYGCRRENAAVRCDDAPDSRAPRATDDRGAATAP